MFLLYWFLSGFFVFVVSLFFDSKRIGYHTIGHVIQAAFFLTLFGPLSIAIVIVALPEIKFFQKPWKY